jgi:hypothetical protein
MPSLWVVLHPVLPGYLKIDMGAVRARSVLSSGDSLHAFVGYVTPLVEVSLFPEL